MPNSIDINAIKLEKDEVLEKFKGPLNSHLATTPVASHAPDGVNTQNNILLDKRNENVESPKNPNFS